jgi:hypothetical protein
VDGRDFADIEAYGAQRRLGELALALRQETYRPDPIRRVFIPKANAPLKKPTIEDGRHGRPGPRTRGAAFRRVRPSHIREISDFAAIRKRPDSAAGHAKFW